MRLASKYDGKFTFKIFFYNINIFSKKIKNAVDIALKGIMIICEWYN